MLTNKFHLTLNTIKYHIWFICYISMEFYESITILNGSKTILLYHFSCVCLISTFRQTSSFYYPDNDTLIKTTVFRNNVRIELVLICWTIIMAKQQGMALFITSTNSFLVIFCSVILTDPLEVLHAMLHLQLYRIHVSNAALIEIVNVLIRW